MFFLWPAFWNHALHLTNILEPCSSSDQYSRAMLFPDQHSQHSNFNLAAIFQVLLCSSYLPVVLSLREKELQSMPQFMEQGRETFFFAWSGVEWRGGEEEMKNLFISLAKGPSLCSWCLPRSLGYDSRGFTLKTDDDGQRGKCYSCTVRTDFPTCMFSEIRCR